MLAPLVAVAFFLAAIVAAFSYLRLEEKERETEAIKRDVEYSQQRMRLRLLERQEQLMHLAQQLNTKEIDPDEFPGRAEALVLQFPEMQTLSWVDERGRIRASHSAPSLVSLAPRLPGEPLYGTEAEAKFVLGDESVTARCTKDEAVKAGWVKNSKWNTEPQTMLRARVKKRGILAMAPEIFYGEYDDGPEAMVSIEPDTNRNAAAAAVILEAVHAVIVAEVSPVVGPSRSPENSS